MKCILRTGLLLTSISGSLAFSQSPYQCTSGNIVRRVEIVYASDAPVPCEVHYVKETESPGDREVLWSAQNETGYCEERALELIAQLRSGGWTCASGAAAVPADDSAVLAPAEDQD